MYIGEKNLSQKSKRRKWFINFNRQKVNARSLVMIILWHSRIIILHDTLIYADIVSYNFILIINVFILVLHAISNCLSLFKHIKVKITCNFVNIYIYIYIYIFVMQNINI